MGATPWEFNSPRPQIKFMKKIFIIPGYGIPKDILKDDQYKRYLGLVFNHIYQICLKQNEKAPLIIFCGGPTDIFKPYQRTEAAEMKKLFLSLARRDFVKKYTRYWRYQLEKNSLSTLENIIGAYRIIKRIKSAKRIFVFVEQTRVLKIKTLAKKIIKNKIQIIPLDFDLSVNRYRDPQFIQRKELADLKISLKVLSDKKFYKQHRKFLIDKINYFRQAGPAQHGEAINRWWQEKLKELEKMGS